MLLRRKLFDEPIEIGPLTGIAEKIDGYMYGGMLLKTTVDAYGI